jgi:trimeric autotransporter adhesin
VMPTLSTGTRNVAMGHLAGFSVTSSVSNILVGPQAGQALTSGVGNNVAVGESALFWDTTAAQNVAIGANAMTGTSGSNNKAQNTAVGNDSMQLCLTPNNCTAVGNLSLRVVSTGSHNCAIGDSTLINETTGTNNVAVGDSAGASQTPGFTNTNSFGYQAFCSASNQVTLGNGSIATIRAQVTTITAISDARFKTEIDDLAIPDGFLDEVRTVTFKWLDPTMPPGTQVGVIAQELDALQIKYDVEWLGLVDHTNPERLEATPHKLLFPLISAFQKQHARLDEIERKLAFLGV